MSKAQSFSRPVAEIPSLDGLRSVSILIVFLGHVGLSSKIPGGFGVTVFFFLSGFLITELLTREWDAHQKMNVKAFYWRRLLRLTPPLLAILLVSYTLLLTGLTFGTFNWTALASQLFYFQNYYLIVEDGAGNGPAGLAILWSLSVEEHFYMLYPLIFILVASRVLKLYHLIALAVLICAWRFYLYGGTESDYWALYSRTDTRFDSILYGCILSIMCWRGMLDKPSIQNNKTMILSLLVSFAVLMFCFIYRDDVFRSTLRYSLQGIALMPVFYYAVYNPNFALFRPLNWRPMKALGLYSYNFYLAHYVIISVFTHNGLFQDNLPLFITANFLVSLAYAATIYYLVEKPIRAARMRRQASATQEAVHVNT